MWESGLKKVSNIGTRTLKIKSRIQNAPVLWIFEVHQSLSRQTVTESILPGTSAGIYKYYLHNSRSSEQNTHLSSPHRCIWFSKNTWTGKTWDIGGSGPQFSQRTWKCKMLRNHSEIRIGLQFYIIKQYNKITNQNFNDSRSLLLLWHFNWTLPPSEQNTTSKIWHCETLTVYPSSSLHQPSDEEQAS